MSEDIVIQAFQEVQPILMKYNLDEKERKELNKKITKFLKYISW